MGLLHNLTSPVASKLPKRIALQRFLTYPLTLIPPKGLDLAKAVICLRAIAALIPNIVGPLKASDHLKALAPLVKLGFQIAPTFLGKFAPSKQLADPKELLFSKVSSLLTGLNSPKVLTSQEKPDVQHHLTSKPLKSLKALSHPAALNPPIDMAGALSKIRAPPTTLAPPEALASPHS